MVLVCAVLYLTALAFIKVLSFLRAFAQPDSRYLSKCVQKAATWLGFVHCIASIDSSPSLFSLNQAFIALDEVISIRDFSAQFASHDTASECSVLVIKSLGFLLTKSAFG